MEQAFHELIPPQTSLKGGPSSSSTEKDGRETAGASNESVDSNRFLSYECLDLNLMG